jgi:hypothetical protein
MKRSRPAPKPGDADKKDEEELRKEKRKSDAAKKAEEQLTTPASSEASEGEKPIKKKSTIEPPQLSNRL